MRNRKEVDDVVVVRRRVGDVKGEIVRKIYPGGRCFYNVYLYRVTEGRSLGVRDLMRMAHVALKLRLAAWVRGL